MTQAVNFTKWRLPHHPAVRLAVLVFPRQMMRHISCYSHSEMQHNSAQEKRLRWSRQIQCQTGSTCIWTTGCASSYVVTSPVSSEQLALQQSEWVVEQDGDSMCLAQIPKNSDENAEVIVSFPGDFLQQKLACTAAAEYMITQDNVVHSLDILSVRLRECILHSDHFPNKKVNTVPRVWFLRSRHLGAHALWDVHGVHEALGLSRYKGSPSHCCCSHHTQRSQALNRTLRRWLPCCRLTDARLSTMARQMTPTVGHQRGRSRAQGGFKSDQTAVREFLSMWDGASERLATHPTLTLALGFGPVPSWLWPLPFEWPSAALPWSTDKLDISRLATMVASSEGSKRAKRLLMLLRKYTDDQLMIPIRHCMETLFFGFTFRPRLGTLRPCPAHSHIRSLLFWLNCRLFHNDIA